MEKEVLNSAADPMGAAIYDYYVNGNADTLIVHSSMFEDDEIPVEDLFRTLDAMPLVERIALEQAKGRILDVGAGSGCHSIALKELGKTSVAIDISPLSVEVMMQRGLDARQVNLFDESFTEKFDTILMLMNGTGIIGTLDNMPVFFERMKQLLAPGGSILIDSSDLRYLYEEEDGSLMIDLADDYYGQLDYRMEYKDILGEPFDWLYVDFETLAIYAEENGFTTELIEEGDHYDYLAKLTIN
ncbi:MAG: methyltransferase domain-containing protein [Bacteroidales bacterium]|nr:methyltransferase domain-containing protein [Bacteroidales bacterium]